MSYFLSPEKITINGQLSFSGDEADHILLSRRLKTGERFYLQDPAGQRFLVELVASDKKSLTVRALKQIPVPQELPYVLVLYQALVAEKAWDFILQKETELGVSEIVLFNAKNTATKLRKEQFQQKLPRWNKILWEAAKQCDRAKIPTLQYVENLEGVLVQSVECGQLLVLDSTGTRLHAGMYDSPLSKIGIVVGPEGGFAEDEVQSLTKQKNSRCVSVAPFVLRAETAAVAGIAAVENIIPQHRE